LNGFNVIIVESDRRKVSTGNHPSNLVKSPSLMIRSHWEQGCQMKITSLARKVIKILKEFDDIDELRFLDNLITSASGP